LIIFEDNFFRHKIDINYSLNSFKQIHQKQTMKPLVSIIMGSTSDYPVMEKAAQFLDEMDIPFEVNALSAHRTPEAVEKFAKNAKANNIKVIIAAAGMAAHLPGVIASMTSIPVIGVPIKATLDGMDALLAIVQMPPGIPVATVGINASLNAAILALQMLATDNQEYHAKLTEYKEGLKDKITQANRELSEIKFKNKTN
jgi:5-(carboxyamino)imidazole ribonucleotide mutase